MGEAAAWSSDDAEVTGGRPTGDGGPEQGADRDPAPDAELDPDRDQNPDPEQGARPSGGRRWLSSWRAPWPPQQWPLAIVVCGIGLSLLVVAVDDFRPGTVLFAGSLLLGALLRLVLPDRQAGLLVLRSRAIDVLLMLIMGMCILLLALLVPDLPGPLPAVQQ